MKILIDAHVFDGKFQGTRTYIKGLYNVLIKRNPNWTFYFISNDKRNIINEFTNLGNVIFLEYRFKGALSRLLFELPYLIRKFNIDYSHFQYISPFLKFGKYIITTHDILFEEQRFKKYFPKSYIYTKGPLFRFSAKKADILLTVSNYSKDQIHDLYNIPKDKIGITPNGVDTLLFKSFMENKTDEDNQNKRKNIIYVSRIEPRKNHISLLKAYINLKLYEKGYHLIFVGSYDLQSKSLDKYIELNKGIFDTYLHIYSNTSEFDLLNLYYNSELVVYPSLAEGFGIPPLEGAILNKKVVCSSLTAMSEFDFFSYHVNPLKKNDLERVINKALKDKNYPYNNIKEIVLKKYTWENSAIEFEKFIDNKALL